jgi:hypothetical protein
LPRTLYNSLQGDFIPCEGEMFLPGLPSKSTSSRHRR